MRRFALLLLLVTSPASAAVVAVLNATDADVRFTVEHPGGKAATFDLHAGRTVTVRVGREPVLRATLNGKPTAFKLDPFTPYLFVADDKGAVAFSGVELAGELPKPDDVPPLPAVWKPLELPVTLFTDAASPLLRSEREKKARERFAAAAAVVDAQVGVRFTVNATEEWEGEKSPETLLAAGGEFERLAVVKDGRAFGFLSRPVKGDDLATPPTPTHALVKEAVPKTNGERVEVIAHQLGRWLGAVRSADGGSVMRAKLCDGKAAKRGWTVQFDPLNLLVMSVWAEELAAGRGPRADQLSPKARRRLHVLYRSIAKVHDAVKSDDTQARDAAEEFASEPDVALPDPNPAPADPAPADKLTDDDKAVRAVVQAVTARAKALAADEKTRPKGDALTAEYVKAAATAAAALDEKRQARAFLLGLGLALDDSTILRDKPVVKKVCVAAEPDDDRKARLEVLGRPTLRGRRDLCQHFAVSAALAEVFGPAAAEFAGMSKELTDMKGTSGFSFTDLSADLAGIELAAVVSKEPKRIADIAKGFAPDDFLPDPAPFEEGLSEPAFKKKFGGPDDARFKAAMDDVRKAVQSLPAFRK